MIFSWKAITLFFFIQLICFFNPISAKATGKLKAGQFPLTIVHVNDIHSHFEEVNVETGRCHEDMAENGECYGGAARMFTLIQDMWNDPMNENMILLNAGDYYQGTIWYSLFKYEPVAEFANMLNYTAMGLGNHDFDDSIAGLKPFADLVNFDLLTTNINETFDDETSVLFGDNVKKSKVVDFDGVQVGIIGYITTYTPDISSPDNNLQFLDEIESVSAEAKRLKADGVDILIALGHAGYEVDVEMAAAIPEIDVVVGGHSHTFLYTGDVPSIEQSEGPYPTYVSQGGTNSKVVPVVQAYCYTKYIGHLRLLFDEQGELLKPEEESGVVFSDVILLDSSIAKDQEVEQAMEKYRNNMTEYYEVIGNTSVLLKKDYQTESNIGNCITDSMVEVWNGSVTIGFINDGGIRASIIIGDITGEDILSVMPFNNTVDRITMTGEGIRQTLEGYAMGLCPNASCYAGTFLQMSGLRVTYDVQEGNEGNRLSRFETICPNGQWCNVDLNAIYSIAIPSFLADGGSRVYNFPDHIIEQERGPIDYDAFEIYVRNHSPIDQGIEGRIIINYNTDSGCSNPSMSIMLYLSTLLVVTLLKA